MNQELPPIKATRKTGQETFRNGDLPLPLQLLDFWQWSSSDLVGNALRGLVAEYLVATAVDASDSVRTEWDAFDVTTPEGITIEVKSGAYIQSWNQKKPSVIRFSVAPTQGWSAETNDYTDARRRHADVYVFAVLNHRDQTTIDPLDVDQWDFYVLAAETLNVRLGEQKTIGLNMLLQLRPRKATYQELRQAIRSVMTAKGTQGK